MQKEFKKEKDLFVPASKEAEEVLKKIKEFNKLVDYLKSEKVSKILNEQLSTKPNERYTTFDHKGNVSGCVSPRKTYIDFHTYDTSKNKRTGKAVIYKDFVHVKSDGKLGSSIDLKRSITPGLKKEYDWHTKLKQVPDNYKPGAKTETITLEKALLIKKTDKVAIKNVKTAKKLLELFNEQNIDVKIYMKHYFNSKMIYIESFYFDYSSFMRIYYEQGKFFTYSLLNRSKSLEEKVEKRLRENYHEKTVIHNVVKKFNEWAKKEIDNSLDLEITFGCNSILMFRKMTINFRFKRGDGFYICSPIEVSSGKNTYNKPSLEDTQKIENIIMNQVDKLIP